MASTLNTCNTQLSTPPISTTPSPKISKIGDFSLTYHYCDLMPNPSKIKQNPYSWEEVGYIVNTNQLELLARSKQETERYLTFKSWLKNHQLQIQDYIIQQELKWTDSTSNNQLFTNSNDVKILLNKFPYYFEDSITHLCIWTKVDIPNDPQSDIGDISTTTRSLIDKYVGKTFPNHPFLWFRNWANLQLVKLISHVHVLVKGLDQEKLNQVLETCGELLTLEDYQELLG